MRMKKLKKILISCIVLLLTFTPNLIQLDKSNAFRNYQDIHQKERGSVELTEQLLSSSPKSNYEIIEEMFSEKLLDYSTEGYFPQVYEASLQAIYYALYILEAVESLDVINQTRIINYIMSYYDENSHIFIDEYSYRYLETDYTYTSHPLTSVLEVNCYAILSLKILNKLELIDAQESINLIWSCYNPISSGFIGQPYDSNLPNKLKVSTMDNTFFAIKTLDLLMGSWVAYNQETSEIIQYINSLQITNNIDWKFGGFYNDDDTSFDSLTSPLFEPNLLSSYYCIKSLEIFGMEYTININNFNQFLESLYEPTSDFFRMSLHFTNNCFANLVATAIGLELSQITGFLSINQNEVINFIFNNRNTLGIWDQSTTVFYHELIDTFQIIRCLKESGEINQLPLQEKNQIASSIALYQQYNGYSLLSNDYTSINLIYNIINSFDLFNRISDIDIQVFYSLIESSYKEDDYFDLYGFTGSTNMDENYISFRSHPIEYYSPKNYLYNHKFTFMALDSLRKLFKLDDFALNYNLMNLVNSILNSQFLDNNFENYGAFLPLSIFKSGSSEYQNDHINLEYSYFAIKTLELLADFLNLGNIVNLTFNKGALYGYIARNLLIFNDMIYFNPHDESAPEKILEHNYYMIYILKALNLFALDRNNITQLILQNIDYNNIENIYYSYKINDILDLGIHFDINHTSSLVGKLYSEEINEFYLSMDQEMIDQKIFLWICEMARNDNLYIQCSYKDSVELGNVNSITARFSNLIFLEYGRLTSVRFESEQLGILNLEKQFDDSYQVNFMVPEEPKFYPVVEGALVIYDYSKIIGQYPISFQTNFQLNIEFLPVKNDDSTEIYMNFSRKFFSGFQPIHNSTVEVDIFLEEEYFETKNFTREDFNDYSQFSLIYNHIVSGNYTFQATLFDEYYPHGLFLFEYSTKSEVIDNPSPLGSIKTNGWILAICGVITSVILAAVVIKGGRWVKYKLKEDNRDIINKTSDYPTGRDDENTNNRRDKYYGKWYK